MTILVASLTILFALVTIKNLENGLLLLVALLPTYLLRANFFGFPTTFLELMLLIVILVWLFQNRHRINGMHPCLLRLARECASFAFTFHSLRLAIKSRFQIEKKWLIPILLLIVASTISIFTATDKTAAIGIYKAYFIEPILFFFVLLDYLKQKSSKEKIYRSLCWSALALSLFGLFQFITKSGIPIPWDIENRITSVFDYPNALGLFLGPIIILGVFQIYKNHKDWFWIITTLLSSVAIILAKSEATWIAIAVSLLIAFALNKQTRKTTIALLVVLIILTAVIPTLKNSIAQKLLLQDYSGQVRITIWKESFEMLKTKPIFGAGLSGFPSALKPYHKATHLELFQYPHNILLNIWTELGILGLLAVALLAFQIVKNSNFITQSLHHSFTFFILLEMTIHGLVDVPYFKNDLSILTWLFIAILITEYASRKNSKKNN